jgi:hypothetical protein
VSQNILTEEEKIELLFWLLGRVRQGKCWCNPAEPAPTGHTDVCLMVQAARRDDWSWGHGTA